MDIIQKEDNNEENYEIELNKDYEQIEKEILDHKN